MAVKLLLPQTHSFCILRTGAFSVPNSLQPQAAKAAKAFFRQQRGSAVIVRASTGPEGLPDAQFDLTEYTEARLENVRHTEKYGHVLFLKLLDGQGSVLPVYIGDFECAALVKEINKRQSARPMTHDLMRNSLELLGFRVTKVRVNALVGNTYHARVHYTRAPGQGGTFEEVDIDARPSDAINLAVRFSAPIYVNKEVASKMAGSLSSYDKGHEESASEIIQSCRHELQQYQDPTIMYKLQMQVAAAEERYDDAAALRNQIEKIMASDRCLSLVIAIETALEDHRYDEAARLRDELKAVREVPASELSDL